MPSAKLPSEYRESVRGRACVGVGDHPRLLLPHARSPRRPSPPPGRFTYTGSLPHTLRQGLAQVDPRYESTRSFHLLSGALKSVSIDHEATARETQAAARATFHWGQDQAPSKREDGAGDEAIVDV